MPPNATLIACYQRPDKVNFRKGDRDLNLFLGVYRSGLLQMDKSLSEVYMEVNFFIG